MVVVRRVVSLLLQLLWRKWWSLGSFSSHAGRVVLWEMVLGTANHLLPTAPWHPHEVG